MAIEKLTVLTGAAGAARLVVRLEADEIDPPLAVSRFLAADGWQVDALFEAPFDRPSLALWGGDDVYAPPEYGDRMADRLGGDSIIFDGCGHWWPASRPEAVAAALEELWGRGA